MKTHEGKFLIDFIFLFHESQSNTIFNHHRHVLNFGVVFCFERNLSESIEFHDVLFVVCCVLKTQQSVNCRRKGEKKMNHISRLIEF